MNYIKVNLNGVEQGLKFNMLAYTEFYNKIDLANWEGSFHYAAVWAGLKTNAHMKGQEFTTAYEEVGDWVDEMSKEDKEALTKVFLETSVFKSLVEDGTPEEKDDTPPEIKKKKSTNAMKIT